MNKATKMMMLSKGNSGNQRNGEYRSGEHRNEDWGYTRADRYDDGKFYNDGSYTVTGRYTDRDGGYQNSDYRHTEGNGREHMMNDYSRQGGAARPFTMADAQEWVGKMENEDGTHGAHWTIDQVKQVIAQKKLDCDPVQMWAAMNMIYSDYYKAAKKHGVGGNLDFYVDMAKAFLDDKDAGPSKISAYYEYVVNGEK